MNYTEEQIKEFKKEYDDLGLILKNSKSNPKNCTSKSNLSEKERSRIYNKRIELKRNITSVKGYEELVAFGPDTTNNKPSHSDKIKEGLKKKKESDNIKLSSPSIGDISIMEVLQTVAKFEAKWEKAIELVKELKQLLTI